LPASCGWKEISTIWPPEQIEQKSTLASDIRN
jgi:hypothetical protein